jgi:hypothetical protein
MSPPRSGSAEAAEVIWDWRHPGAERTDQPGASRQRVRGIVQAGIGATVATVFLFVGWRTPAFIVYGIASLIALAALLSPTGVYALLDRMTVALGERIGRVLTWTVLVPVFYLFFVPFGKIFRAGRRDRMKRHFDSEATTYWEPHEGPTAASTSHERQY